MLLFFVAMIVSEKTETQMKQIIVFLSLYVLYALFTLLYPVIVGKYRGDITDVSLKSVINGRDWENWIFRLGIR